MNDLEERLDPAQFFRVSRTAIVNLDSVSEVLPLTGGIADVILKNGVRLEVIRAACASFWSSWMGSRETRPPRVRIIAVDAEWKPGIRAPVSTTHNRS